VRKRALAAAALLLSSAAGAWWFVARTEAPGDAARGRVADAVPRESLVPAESASTIDATRTENRDLAAPSPAANHGADAFASGATNWDQTSKTSGIELDVIDATTRERLRGVTIEQGGENYESATSREPPCGGPHALEIAADAERTAVAHGDAPVRIELPPKMRRGRIRYLIGAPGHATVARWFDVSISGWRRHVVALEGGWALNVVVRGGGAAQRGKVELFDDDHLRQHVGIVPGIGDDAENVARNVRAIGAGVSIAFETKPSAAQFERRVEALPYGRWLGLATFSGGSAKRRHAIADAFVDDEAEGGQEARMEFDLSEVPPPHAAPFAGTIRFAPGWTAGEVASARKLEFTALDADPLLAPLDCFVATAVPTSDDHRLEFDAQWHSAGRHALTLEGIAAVLAVDVEGTAGEPTEATRPIELLVDEPATVTLRARDRSGAPRAIVLFRFVAGPREVRHDRACGRLATQSDGSTVRFRVPCGPFHFETEPRASVSFVERDVVLAAGENLLDLEVGEYSGVRLALRDGDVPLPWTFGTEIVVARADAPRDPLDVRPRTTLLGSECQIDLEAPCRYVVSVRDVPGFEDPAPVEFAVEPGKVVRVEVVLTTPR